jgi:aspartyl-tRNA(Asn)/glutamyl-tRNA(Gln) amidotransferase subunit A
MYRKSRAQGFGLQPKLRVLMGMYVSAAQYSEQYYNRALRVRSLIRRDFDEAFANVDLLLTPTTPSAAFKIGGIYGDSVLMQYADQLVVPGNHAGVPGISIPAGFDEENMPIGVHFYAPDFREDLLFRAGRAYEQATELEHWRQKQLAILR